MKRILFVLALVFVVPVDGSAQAPFYQDKTIRIIAGYGAGSVDDAWTRLIARYLAKHIPGNPNMIVQNMPGAGAMIAANYVYKVAKPDGLTLWRHSQRAIFRSACRQTTGSVRLAEVYLARQSDPGRTADLYSRQHAV